MVFAAIAGIFIVAIVGGVGLGVASADSSDDVARAGAFGFDASTQNATAQEGSSAPAEIPGAFYEQSALAGLSTRTVDSGMKMIDAQEQAERDRAAAEEAAIAARVQETKAMQGVSSDAGADAQEQAMEYNLPAVDWSVGKDAFISEWTARIDAYLSGTELAGYGRTFAEAAWENAVDPRWSPAISNTESGNGAACFLPHNAWGWGSSSWPDWDTAIRDHVAGLASGYGYSITLDAAHMYCPPTYVQWYNATLGQMALI